MKSKMQFARCGLGRDRILFNKFKTNSINNIRTKFNVVKFKTKGNGDCNKIQWIEKTQNNRTVSYKLHKCIEMGLFPIFRPFAAQCKAFADLQSLTHDLFKNKFN